MILLNSFTFHPSIIHHRGNNTHLRSELHSTGLPTALIPICKTLSTGLDV